MSNRNRQAAISDSRSRQDATVETAYGTRTWSKFIHSNKDGRADCQLVTMLNAYYYMYGRRIQQDSATYERLTDECHCRNGTALQIDKLHRRYRMRTTEYGALVGFSSRNVAMKWLPVEATVQDRRYGRHSVLIIDYAHRPCAVRVLNAGLMDCVASNGWTLLDIFLQFVRSARSFKPL